MGNTVGFSREPRPGRFLLDDIAAEPFENSPFPLENSPFPLDYSPSSVPLAAERTRRKDPLDGFKKYTNGWNISEKHYWAVSFINRSSFCDISF